MCIDDLDWQDSGKKVRLNKDGLYYLGVISAVDAFFDGENEHPVWEVELDSGDVKPLHDFDGCKLIHNHNA